jgi:hypothetical protein
MGYQVVFTKGRSNDPEAHKEIKNGLSDRAKQPVAGLG